MINLSVEIDPTLKGPDPIKSKNVLLSAHRAGALNTILLEMGIYVLEDIELLDKGLPVQNCKIALPETVYKLRSNPINKS